jgi:hypothetical protein
MAIVKKSLSRAGGRSMCSKLKPQVKSPNGLTGELIYREVLLLTRHVTKAAVGDKPRLQPIGYLRSLNSKWRSMLKQT